MLCTLKKIGSALASLALAELLIQCGGGTGTTPPISPPLNSAPTITALTPSSATAGGAGFTLKVNGSGFVPASVVQWNGNSRTTTFVSSSQLTASIAATDIASSGTAVVAVFNPPPSGGTSAGVSFTINVPAPVITSLMPSSATAGAAGFTLRVNGSGFVPGSVVQWNGSDRATTFVSSSELTAPIGAIDIGSSGTAAVTVLNPSPPGGTSVAAAFTINTPTSNWTFLGAPNNDPTVQQIAVDAQDQRILYVATDGGLFVSRDGGASWALLVTAKCCFNGVIAPDPNTVNRVFYGQANNLYVSTDRGVTWNLVATFDPVSYFRSLLVSGIDPHTVFVGLQGANGMFYKSTDDGVSWQSYSFGYQPSANILPWVIAEDPLDGMLYVGVELADHPQPYHPPFFRSADLGLTWQNVAGSGPASPNALWWHVISIVIHPTNHKVFVLQEGAGLYTSVDHGLTWTQAPNVVYFTCGLLMDPNRDNRFFGGWVVGGTLTGGALISTDGAATFIPFGLENRTVCSLETSGDSKSLYAAAYGSGIYATPLP